MLFGNLIQHILTIFLKVSSHVLVIGNREFKLVMTRKLPLWYLDFIVLEDAMWLL